MIFVTFVTRVRHNGNSREDWRVEARTECLETGLWETLDDVRFEALEGGLDKLEGGREGPAVG